VTAGLYLLSEYVTWVCSQYHGSVTSWWRSGSRNTAKGGRPNSLHLYGLAVDVVYDGPPPRLEDLQHVARVYFVRIVREADHDHFQTDWPSIGEVTNV
jgi:hypothetical protein